MNSLFQLTQKASKTEMVAALNEARKSSIYDAFVEITEEDAKTALFEDAYQIASSYTEKEIRLALSMHMAMKRKKDA